MKKSEGKKETPREEAAVKLKEELKQRREKFKGKGLDVLLAESLLTADKIIHLAKEDDWEKIKLELMERFEHFNRLQILFHSAFIKKSKEAGDYLKWTRLLDAKSWAFMVVIEVEIKEREKLLKKYFNELNNVEGLKKKQKRKIYQWKSIFKEKRLASLRKYNFTTLNPVQRRWFFLCGTVFLLFDFKRRCQREFLG